MPGEGIQLQMLTHQRMQPIEALAHIARCQAQIYMHTGRQGNHARNAYITVRNIVPPTPELMSNRSPLANTSSREARASSSRCVAPRSTSAKHTGLVSRSRFRQL